MSTPPLGVVTRPPCCPLTFRYILLIPLNLFGLALPTTTLLTLLPPAFLALGILEQPSSNEANEAATKALLAYFVTLGFIQFLESAAAGLLERRIRELITLLYSVAPRLTLSPILHRQAPRAGLPAPPAHPGSYQPPQQRLPTSACPGSRGRYPRQHPSPELQR